MAIDIAQDYSRFYRGTEAVKSYGPAEGPGVKDTLVRYEFCTTDEHGNKIMDRMSKEETLAAMKDISAQYGDNVIVEFSGDAMAALVEVNASGKTGILDELMRPDPAKQAAFEAEVVQLENTHRIIIPNIRTNEMLSRGLDGAGESVVRAATGIIKNYLLPGSADGLSEQQRKDRIAFGLESARYLAENYLEADRAEEFLGAMETIAKYGLAGTVSPDGRITYDIRKGPMLGAPDDAVDMMDILKRKAPELYREIKELNQSIIDHRGEGGFGKKFLELHKRAEKVLDSPSGAGGTNREEAVRDYAMWKSGVEETALPESFQNVRYGNGTDFLASLRDQGSLSSVWLEDNVGRLLGWLCEDAGIREGNN